MSDMDDIQESISSLISSIDTLGIYIGQIDSCLSGDWQETDGRRGGIRPLVEVIEKLIIAIDRSQK